MSAPSDRGVLILGGPTASGKTGFALELAACFGAEIIGADSRQIYRGMAIGTAAPTPEQQARIRHHLVGWIDPYEEYSAARFVTDAAAAIASIHARGKRAIVVGGTGFYLRALCGDVDLAAEPDPSIRARVIREMQAHPLEVMHDWLRARDPARAASVSARDPYRIGRALEIRLAADAGVAPARPRPLPTLRTEGIAFVKLALRVEPALLASRIAARTDAMLAAGLIAEAERVGADACAADAVGYADALAFQAGQLTVAELRARLERATRRYAKRQLTWLRAEPDLAWIELGDLAAVSRSVARLGWEPAFSGDV